MGQAPPPTSIFCCLDCSRIPRAHAVDVLPSIGKNDASAAPASARHPLPAPRGSTWPSEPATSAQFRHQYPNVIMWIAIADLATPYLRRSSSLDLDGVPSSSTSARSPQRARLGLPLGFEPPQFAIYLRLFRLICSDYVDFESLHHYLRVIHGCEGHPTARRPAPSAMRAAVIAVVSFVGEIDPASSTKAWDQIISSARISRPRRPRCPMDPCGSPSTRERAP